MASAKDIKKRIKGVKNIQQITKAMEMVAGAKLRRAQNAAERAKAYSDKIQTLMHHMGSSASGQEHPLLADRAGNNIALVLITSDKGLCGAYNSNLLKKTQAFIKDNTDKQISLFCLGKKGNDFFARRDYDIKFFSPSDSKVMTIEKVNKLVGQLMEDYLESKLDKIIILFSEFMSIMRQVPTERQLLPVKHEAEDGGYELLKVDYIFEPDPETLLDKLFPKYVENQLYNALVESYASELASRLVSMKNATKSAGEMMDNLTLSYNKARQTGITNEILEIVSGAEALKG